MKWHVLHPVWVAIGVVGLIVLGGRFLVPDDFGVHGRSFTYGYYRLSNLQDWKDFSVKHQGRDYCAMCHVENARTIDSSVHAPVQCENCHGPGVDHPASVPRLNIDTSRELCLRCHAYLGYPNSDRGAMPSVSASEHMQPFECSQCHDPHMPREKSE